MSILISLLMILTLEIIPENLLDLITIISSLPSLIYIYLYIAVYISQLKIDEMSEIYVITRSLSLEFAVFWAIYNVEMLHG